jgi:hypothetical protein
MTRDIFAPLFEFRDRRLAQLGDPLLKLNEHIGWDGFRPLPEKVHKKERKSNAGAKPKDVLMMF